MSELLNRTRQPQKPASFRVKLLYGVYFAVFGLLIGVGQKWLDSLAVNELPQIIQWLDITNFLGRLAVWMLMGVMIVSLCGTPLMASAYTFVFFISMVTGYYLYCRLVLGFLPVNYAMIWVAGSFASAIAAYICWYAFGEGPIAILISGVILGAVSAQTFLFLQGFMVTHVTEVIVWIITVIKLWRKPREMAIVFVISLIVSALWQMFIPYWG